MARYITLNPKTVKAQRFIASYNNSTYTNITELYKKPSSTKINIFNKIYYSLDDYQYIDTVKVWGNTSTFVIGYKGYAGYYIITHSHEYFIPYVK